MKYTKEIKRVQKMITDLKEADLTGMKAEAFFSTENYDHYSIATWSK